MVKVLLGCFLIVVGCMVSMIPPFFWGIPIFIWAGTMIVTGLGRTTMQAAKGAAALTKMATK